MSYNISNWKTKRLENLVIPARAFDVLSADLKRRGWEQIIPKLARIESGGFSIEVSIAEGTRVSGKLINSYANTAGIAVNEIYAYGEASRTAYQEILLPALRQSTGTLEAVLVWEGGDSITRLIVQDGEITEEEVEL